MVLKIVAEFPRKNWSVASVNRLLQSGVFSKSECRLLLLDPWHLKERVLEHGITLDQRIIDRAVSQWRQRLLSCICENGGHF